MTQPAESRAEGRAAAKRVVAVMFVPGAAEVCLPAIASLAQAHPGIHLVAGARDERTLGPIAAVDPDATLMRADSLPALVNAAWIAHHSHLLVLAPTALVPRQGLHPAFALVDEDARVASVSVLSNAAAFLSFPHLGTPVAHQIEGLDEHDVTQRLRELGPRVLSAPVPFATGPAIVLSAYALSAIGPLDTSEGVEPGALIADFCLRAQRRGFVDVVEPSTYCARFSEAGLSDEGGGPGAPAQSWLLARHPFGAAELSSAEAGLTPLSIVHATARAKVLGLQVLIDGSCLGPRAMGTQVQTLALVAALARRPDVSRVGVALGPGVPGGRLPALEVAKIDARPVAGGDLATFGAVDVVHRPFQPDGPLDTGVWRQVGARTVVTVLDLIAYGVGAYHSSPERWLAYRRELRQVTADVDGVVTPSHDVGTQIQRCRLPVEDSRLFVAELGTDHLRGDEQAHPPGRLLGSDAAEGEFLLVVGANYAHKNRDIALAATAELRRRGRDVSLVLVGAAVPFGSSRVAEAQAWPGGDGVVVIPDVSPEERNWLLRHASVVLYPTSSEGFGFVPWEAARFGTPTVFVPFGPLDELCGELPVTVADWDPQALADATGRLLADPALRAEQVSVLLSRGPRYTWDATAAKLVEIYRTLLSLPPRRPERCL